MQVSDKQLKVFFSLINFAVSGKEINDIQALDEDDIKALFSLAKKHDLAHLIAYSLIKSRLITKENALYKKVLAEQLQAISRSEKGIYALDSLCEILEKEKVKFIPLKGSVISSYYPEKWMRTSCDIDLLIEKERAEEISRILQNEYSYALDGVGSLHDYGFITPNGVRLELHFNLEQERKFELAEKILDNPFSYAIDIENKTCQKVLDNNFMTFYHITHMAKHFLHGGCGIKPFIDVFIMNEKGVFSENKLNEFLSKAQLSSFYKGVKALIGVWFKGGEHTDLTYKMQSYILTGGVYGTVQNYATVNRVKGKGKIKTFFSIMFLPKKSLEIIYPKLKKHPILLPFYQVKRWFKVFNKKSRLNAQSQLSASASVSLEQRESLSKLMEELGV